MLFQVPRWHSFWVNPVEVVLTRWFRLFCPIFSFRLITQSQCLCTSDPAGRVVPSFSCALTPSLCPCMCIGHREIPMILPLFALLICYILNTGYWRGWLFVKWSSTGMWCHMAIASSRDSSCILRRRFSVPPYSYRLPLLVSSLFPFSSFSQSPGPGTACFRTFLFFWIVTGLVNATERCEAKNMKEAKVIDPGYKIFSFPVWSRLWHAKVFWTLHSNFVYDV